MNQVPLVKNIHTLLTIIYNSIHNNVCAQSFVFTVCKFIKGNFTRCAFLFFIIESYYFCYLGPNAKSNPNKIVNN